MLANIYRHADTYYKHQMQPQITMKSLSLAVAVAALSLSSCSTESASADSKDFSAITHAEVNSSTEVKALNSQEVKTLLEQQQDIVILDVRTAGEYASGHLQHSELMDFYSPDFSERLKALDPEKTYLVYCAVGGRSREAAQQLQRLGFGQVYDATEGFAALMQAGVPVE
ncbi:MAG: rhodanese-like domain-containing protein [Pontibacter sp.]|nr:rhodanese-like domain-containing protein [Pontibacter sp.]